MDWQDRRVGTLVKRRGIWEEEVKVVEGLALRKPRRSMATIHRQVSKIA
ncbi:hypothetical protein KSC_110550 [Ktedonobacter sp. SOSP1-52]|nr:hypothetical protein [Ktedonobacter sp. SOSP1-52]GHO72163.1 hypothetical protein KSC_110550 [Ktedonobacter sp. SOSP1-52]